jgi:Spy/CpxP family protein refolding chaperone
MDARVADDGTWVVHALGEGDAGRPARWAVIRRRRVMVARAVLCCALAVLAGSATADAQSPHAGQESRAIKALSSEEIADYLSGKGMGLAKAAELNGYPGPAHVLELATQLDLTPEQRSQTEILVRKMQARAIALGTQLVDEERALDRLFTSRAVSSETLASSLARIGALQGRVRQVHLEAHLEQTAVLTAKQIETYTRLRGYGGSGGHETHEQRRH